jgi:hypothetical protein
MGYSMQNGAERHTKITKLQEKNQAYIISKIHLIIEIVLSVWK